MANMNAARLVEIVRFLGDHMSSDDFQAMAGPLALTSKEFHGLAWSFVKKIRQAKEQTFPFTSSFVGLTSAWPRIETVQLTNATSLEPLRHCVQLHTLDCSRTSIASLEPLRECLELQKLDCSWTCIASHRWSRYASVCSCKY
jgi:hypothetical protein